jgi:phosphatidate cytidylyltransferase
MSNFWARTITGLTMVFILLAALYLGGWFFASVFLLITVLALWEFYRLVSGISKPQTFFGIVSGSMLYVVITIYFFYGSDPGVSAWLHPAMGLVITCLLFCPFIIEIFRNKTSPLINIAITIAGVVYVALPLALLNSFSSGDAFRLSGIPVLLTGYFILTWFYDTAAYLYGKQYGRHKFFERISPKKTWEGTIAGAAVAFLTAGVFTMLPARFPAYHWIILAVVVVFFGTVGDLAESMLKRSLEVKDSGTILPGHGGILDRFDTILISSPFVFLYFQFFT